MPCIIVAGLISSFRGKWIIYELKRFYFQNPDFLVNVQFHQHCEQAIHVIQKTTNMQIGWHEEMLFNKIMREVLSVCRIVVPAETYVFFNDHHLSKAKFRH